MLKHTKRKAQRLQSFSDIVHSVHRANVLANTIQTNEQRLLSKFQRYSLIEEQDFTESSEAFENFFDPANRD